MCQTKTEIQTNFMLPDALTIVKTESEESISSTSPDVCCRAFVIGDDSMRSACNERTETIAQEYIWNGSECQQRSDIEIIFSLISDQQPLKTESDVILSLATEDDCTICADEIIGDSIFAYDECSLACSKTDAIGEVCRYTDMDNSVRSSGITMDFTNTVDRD